MDTNSKKPRVLIIDDEAMLVKAMKKKLENSGFETLVAYSGSEGLEVAQRQHPDLILLDIVLPLMDGITVLDNLRKDEWGKTVPVIILTNLSKGETIEEGKERGVSTYLIKTDWRLDEVIEKIKYELGIL